MSPGSGHSHYKQEGEVRPKDLRRVMRSFKPYFTNSILQFLIGEHYFVKPLSFTLGFVQDLDILSCKRLLNDNG